MKGFIIALVSIFALSFAQDTVLTAVKVGSTTLDAAAADWSKAPILELQTKGVLEGDPDGPLVMLQAIYDKESIAFRAEWADATESIFKSAWTFDGSGFSKSGDEDRLLMVWPIQNNAQFASKGCTAACHNSSDNRDEWYMGSDDEALTYDAWHWKATRTNPAGYVDDQWWGVKAADEETGRKNDAKDSGGEKANANEDGTAPIFMSAKGPQESFIFASDKVDLDLGKLSAGTVIPGYVLERAVGSRGDIDVQGVWQDGKWVVVMRRLLDTGHEDDVAFTVRRRVPFGLAVIDNGGSLDHRVVPEVLTLDWK